MKSGSPSSTVTGDGSIPLGGHGRSISLCHERANSPAGVRNLCNTPRDGASGDHVARRGLGGRACCRWLAIHAAAAVLRHVRPRRDRILGRGIQRRDRPRRADDPRGVDLHRHQSRLRVVRDPRRGARARGDPRADAPSEVDRAAARTLIRRIPQPLRTAAAGRLDPARHRSPPPAQSAAAPVTIVSDTPDTAAMIAANAERAELGSRQGRPWRARTRCPDAGTRVVVLHDASPRGVALVQDLRDSGVDVVDGGLRPREVDGPRIRSSRVPRRAFPATSACSSTATRSTGCSAAGAWSSPRCGRRSPWIGFVRAISQAAPLHGDAPQPAR